MSYRTVQEIKEVGTRRAPYDLSSQGIAQRYEKIVECRVCQHRVFKTVYK